MPSARACGSEEGTFTPVTPSSTISESPPTSETTTGTLDAIVLEIIYFDPVWDDVNLSVGNAEFVLDMVEHIVAATDDPVALLCEQPLDVANFPTILTI